LVEFVDVFEMYVELTVSGWRRVEAEEGDCEVVDCAVVTMAQSGEK
jgi:hypothetical protein